jgi:hypothetical protein
MIKESYDVVLVDFSGILPFKLERENILTRQEEIAIGNLKQFILDLESSLKYESVYLGADFLETRFFHRLIMKDGLLELLIGTPITLIGHFKEKENAEQFKSSLEEILNKTLPSRLRPMLIESIEIKKVERSIVPSGKKGLSKLG